MKNESAVGEVELKPCPFCDGEAYLKEKYNRHFEHCFSVECKNDCVINMNYYLAEYAIKKWNTRAPLKTTYDLGAKDGDKTVTSAIIPEDEYDRLKRLEENVKNKIAELKASCDKQTEFNKKINQLGKSSFTTIINDNLELIKLFESLEKD